jgi:hypothetical protein
VQRAGGKIDAEYDTAEPVRELVDLSISQREPAFPDAQ